MYHTYVLQYWVVLAGIVIHGISRSSISVHMMHLQMLRRRRCNGGPIFKVVPDCSNGLMNLFLSVSLAYNVTSCRKSQSQSQIMKIVDLAMYWAPELRNHQKKTQKKRIGIAIYLICLICMAYIGWHLDNPHIQRIQIMYDKGRLMPPKVEPYFLREKNYLRQCSFKIQYLSSFSSCSPTSKKFNFSRVSISLWKIFFVGLLRSQFWCHRPST